MVGEAGVGKTAIVEGLAQQIVNKQVPEPLLNKRILGLDLMSVMAGASHKGEFEERMKGVIDEVKASKGQIILFIDEIHNIVAGGEGSGDAGNLLKPAIHLPITHHYFFSHAFSMKHHHKNDIIAIISPRCKRVIPK